MTKQQKSGLIVLCLTVFVSMPIGYYLQYQILQRVGASYLMWFCYWLGLPVYVAIQVIAELAKNRFRDSKDVAESDDTRNAERLVSALTTDKP